MTSIRCKFSPGGQMKITLPVMLMAMLAIGAIGQAQDRMPPIPADKVSPEQKKAVEEFRAARQAEVTGPFIPLLRSPEVMIRTRAMGDYLRYKSALPPRLSGRYSAHDLLSLGLISSPEHMKLVQNSRTFAVSRDSRRVVGRA